MQIVCPWNENCAHWCWRAVSFLWVPLAESSQCTEAATWPMIAMSSSVRLCSKQEDLMAAICVVGIAGEHLLLHPHPFLTNSLTFFFFFLIFRSSLNLLESSCSMSECDPQPTWSTVVSAFTLTGRVVACQKECLETWLWWTYACETTSLSSTQLTIMSSVYLSSSVVILCSFCF